MADELGWSLVGESELLVVLVLDAGSTLSARDESVDAGAGAIEVSHWGRQHLSPVNSDGGLESSRQVRR